MVPGVSFLLSQLALSRSLPMSCMSELLNTMSEVLYTICRVSCSKAIPAIGMIVLSSALKQNRPLSISHFRFLSGRNSMVFDIVSFATISICPICGSGKSMCRLVRVIFLLLVMAIGNIEATWKFRSDPAPSIVTFDRPSNIMPILLGLG